MTAGSSSRAAIAVVASLLGAAIADAAPSATSAAATAQFEKGRDLMKAKKYAEACEAFERSEQLEAAPGTEFNLASCYVQIRKLASAWTLFTDLGARDRNPARRKASRQRAAALEPRLPRVVLAVRDAPAKLAVTIDGADVTGAVGIETPIDLGSHAIEASAPGFAAFTITLEVTEEAKRYPVEIVLAPEGAEPAGGDPGRATPSTGGTGGRVVVGVVHPKPTGSSRRRTAVLVGAGGGALVAAGAVFALLARGDWNDAKALCGDDLTCDDAGQLAAGNELVDSARSRANIATGLWIGGGVAVAVAVGLYVTAPRARDDRRAVRAVPVIAPGTAGIALGGRF